VCSGGGTTEGPTVLSLVKDKSSGKHPSGVKCLCELLQVYIICDELGLRNNIYHLIHEAYVDSYFYLVTFRRSYRGNY
jgi:hypothetical protein